MLRDLVRRLVALLRNAVALILICCSWILTAAAAIVEDDYRP